MNENYYDSGFNEEDKNKNRTEQNPTSWSHKITQHELRKNNQNRSFIARGNFIFTLFSARSPIPRRISGTF